MCYFPASFALALFQSAGPAAGLGFLFWLILGVVIGFLLSFVLRKPKASPQRSEHEAYLAPQSNIAPPIQTPARRAATHARRCPVCNSTYTDEALIYCVSDGASLVPVINSSSQPDPGATLLYRETGNRDVPPTAPSRPDENQR